VEEYLVESVESILAIHPEERWLYEGHSCLPDHSPDHLPNLVYAYEHSGVPYLREIYADLIKEWTLKKGNFRSFLAGIQAGHRLGRSDILENLYDEMIEKYPIRGEITYFLDFVGLMG
jgi:hypothetical protein